jgi:ABC-type nickel/cobalt efflux system permease component RcnA
VLSALVVAAGEALPPEWFQRIAQILSAVVVVGIGVWMVAAEVRRRWVRAPVLALAGVGFGGTGLPQAVAPTHRLEGVDDDHPHASEHLHHQHGAGDHAHDQRHAHGDHAHDQRQEHGEHGHGPFRHRHDAPAGASLSWRGLFTLGLAGGIIPSTSALLILLATVATGRATYGLVLVVMFGLGMAAVMVAIGLTFVLARERIERVAGDRARSGRSRPAVAALSAAPAVGSVVVLALGVVLTAQAIGGGPTL